MKDQKTDIEKMIMRAHYLHSLEKESSSSTPLSEMERQDFVNSLSSKDSIIESLRSSLSVVLETLESANRQIEQLRSQFQSQQSQTQSLILELTKEIAHLRSALEKQTAYNSLHNKMRFGKKTNKSEVKSEDLKSREEESEDYDGSDNNLGSPIVSSSIKPAVKEPPLDRRKVNSENLDKKEGKRRGTYK